MKSEKGVTLTALIIYIMVMVFAVAAIVSLTSYFYKNAAGLDDSGKNAREFNRFNMYMLSETKKSSSIIELTSEQNSYVRARFSSGNILIYQDGGIYMNYVKICNNVTNFEFRYNNNNKNKIEILITIGTDMPFTKTANYVLE